MANPPLLVVSRVAGALVGGYAFVWGFTTLLMAVALSLGDDFHDAEQLAHVLAFLVFLGVLLWAFASPKVGKVWLVLAGGGAVMTGLAWAVTQTLH
jgi:hypothetical protein